MPRRLMHGLLLGLPERVAALLFQAGQGPDHSLFSTKGLDSAGAIFSEGSLRFNRSIRRQMEHVHAFGTQGHRRGAFQLQRLGADFDMSFHDEMEPPYPPDSSGDTSGDTSDVEFQRGNQEGRLVWNERLQARIPVEINDGILAGRHAQARCAFQHVNGANRMTQAAEASVLGYWNWTSPYCWENATAKSILCSAGSITSEWGFAGERFGCVPLAARHGESGKLLEDWSHLASHSGKLRASLKHAANTMESLAEPAAVPEPNWKDSSGLLKSPDGLAVVHFLDYLMRRGGTLAAAALYKGHLVERYNRGAGVDSETKLHGWSVAKPILSLLIGARISQKKMALLDLGKMPEASVLEKEFRGLTVENMLNMRIGNPLHENGNGTVQQMLWGRPGTAEFAIHGSELTWERKFRYSSGTANLLSRELRMSFPPDEAGFAEYAAYPWKTLFNKIGATSFSCQTDARGTIVFSTFCFATARDWLKFGQLVMHKGRWDATGEQVIPQHWVEQSTSLSNDDHPWYTHLWYRGDSLYHAEVPILLAKGVFSSELVIVPSLDFVFMRLGPEDVPLWPDDVPNGRPLLPDLLNTLAKGSDAKHEPPPAFRTDPEQQQHALRLVD